MAKEKDWREKYKEKDSSGKESTTSNWRDKYKEYNDYNSAKIVGEQVTSMLEDWQKNYNSYVTDYTNRFSKRKGSYEDAYVGDSLEWLNAETEKRSALKKQEDDILAYLNQYGGHLDSKWVKQVFDTIEQAKNAQYKIHSGATKDNEYWAKFTPNDDQAAAGYTAEKLYNEWQAGQKQYAEDMAFDIYSGGVDLEILKHEKAMYLKEQEEKRKQAQENESWMDKVGRWLGTTPDTSLPLGGASGSTSNQSRTPYDSQISALEEQIERAKYVQGYEDFMDNMDAEDYDANSRYASTRTDVAMEDAMWGFGKTQYDTSKLFGDFMYDYINRNEDAINAGMVNDTATDAYFLGFDKGFLKTMTDDEIGVYNYLYKTQGKESANAFLSHIESDLEGRRRAQEQVFWAAYAKTDPAGSSVFSTLISPLKGMSYIGQAADMLDDGKMEENAGYNRFSYIPSTIRSQVSTTIEKSGKWGKVGSFAYNTGMSMADFLFTTAVSGGNQALSLAIMGSGAAADATLAAKDRGLDDAQAFTLGTIAGLAEVAMEKISLGAWLEGDMSEGALRYILKNALSEGGEEASTSIVNLLADVIIAGDKSEWDMAMQAYIEQGKSEAEAFGLVLAENAAQIGLDALGGALSGSAIGGGTYAGRSIATNIGKGIQYSNIAKDKTASQELVSNGLELNPDSKYIQKMQGKLESGKKLSGTQVRKILSVNMQKIQKAAEKRLTDLGQTDDVGKIASLVAKNAMGQKLTRDETSTLVRSKYGSQVAKEMRDAVAQAEKAAYKPLEERVEEEKPAKVSNTGKAVISGTDQQVDLTAPKIKKITADSVILEVDGKDVDMDSIEFANENHWNMFNALKKIEHITPAVASDMIAKIDTSKPIWGQMNGMDEAFTYGYWNYSEADLDSGLFATYLTNKQQNDAYKLGQYVRKNEVKVDETNRKRMRTAAEAKLSKKEKAAQQKARIESDDVDVYFMDGKSTVKFDEHTGKYDPKRTAAVNTAKFLKKLGIGGKFVFYESYERNGKRYYKDKNGVERPAPNGFYDPADGSIYIDLNAGNDGSGKALFTMGHELAHFVKHRSEKQFKILSDMVTEAFDKTNLSMHKRALAKQEFLQDIRGKGEKVSYSEAYEEVVADAMSTMLTDGSFYDTLMEIKVKHKDLFATIKKFFTDMIAKFKQEYENIDPDQQDARDIRALKDAFDKIQKAFAESLVVASENFEATEAQKNTTEKGGVKLMSRDQNQNVIVDENVDSQSVRKVLTAIFNGNYKSNNNYFPVLKHTPEVYKTYCHLDADRSFVMARKKAYKAMHNHALGVDGLMYVIENLGTPDYIVYQTVGEYAGNYAAIIISEEREIFAAVQLGEYKDAQYAPAGEKGYYNTLITAFYPNEGYLDDNIFIPENDVVYDKNEDPLQVASGVTPSDRAERSSANNIRNDSEFVKNESVEALDVEVDAKTESVAPTVLKSERTWTSSDYVQERDKAAKEIAKAIGVTEQKAKDYIDSINSIAKMIADDRSRLDYFSSPGRTSFIGNVEYGGSFDFSTLCKKRRLLTGTFTAIQKALPNTVLTADEILDIRNRMKEANLEVSCGLCYVEGSRSNMGQFAKEFLRLYKQYYPDAWQPNMADVNTPDGIEWVRINHPECYEQYEYFWNHYGTLKDGDKNLFASQKKPKLYQLHTEYKGEILDKFKDDDNVEEKNLNGGIRLQSFSDFEIVHLIDTMQIIMDMSRVGLAGQAYTKVPDFAWALGDTGLKINLSLISKGVDENGKLIFDDVEGMPIADAMKLRDRYSKNVGTILVAFNDEQLLAAMADERVDFIIPFHRSQWKKSQYEAMGLPAKTKDYTFMQNEKYIKPRFHEYRGRMVKDKATNYMPNEYWDFSKSGKENAEAYLEMCARNNKRPKFYKLLQNNGDGSYSLKADGSTDGYWKLLIDFKMYDNEGTGSPQMAVKPEFNMEEANRMLNDYKGGHSNFPVAQGIVDGFVKDYKASHKGQKFSERDSTGKQLTEEQQEFFKDSKIRDNGGNLLVVRHGTNEEFHIFDFAKSGKNGKAEGYGFYFSDDHQITSRYGDIQKEVYLNITKPLYSNKRTIKKAELVKLTNALIDFNLEKYKSDGLVWQDSFISNYVNTYEFQMSRRYAVQEFVNQIWDYNTNDQDLVFEIAQGDGKMYDSSSMKEFYDVLMKSIGYDGIIAEWTHADGTSNVYVTFDSEQSKYTSNTKPTSNPDMRYSERGEDSSNRSLLANAFEGITKSSIEYKMIQEYKGHIKNLNALEKNLSKLNEEIRKIYRTPGKRDTARLKKLTSMAEEISKEITRHDRELLSLEASEPLRKVIERERKKEAQKTKAHVQEIQQNRKDRAEQTELRHKIRKAIRDLDKLLNRGNKKLNVKDDLQPVVTKALQAAEILFTDNYGNYDMLRNGIGADLSDAEEALVESCAKMLKDLDKMPTDGYENFQARQEAENRLRTKMSKLNEVFARERKRLNNTKVSSILGELADAYKSLETSDQSYVQGAYSEPVYNFLKNLQSEVGGTIVKDMSKDQLENVYAAYRMVLTTVRKANQMFNEELKLTREQLGNAVIQEVLNAGGVHQLGTKLGDAISQFDWNNMKPIWLANRVGSETFGKLVNGLFKGQYNFAVDIDGAKQFKLEMDKKYKPRNWDAEKLYEFRSSTGKEFSLNLQQIMSLYAFSKREQAYSHLLNGGFVFEDNSTVVVDGKLGIKKTYIHKGATSYKLNEATLNGIINSLTKEQKAYVDEMQKYLSDVMGAKGNEVSMQLYGIKMFNEQFYFPLRSSGDYMERAKEAELKKQQGQINLVNSGFTHSVKPEAKNPIVLSGFMDVWAEHCNEMSMYHSMVLPMEDFRKVYNYSTPHEEGADSYGVYAAIKNAYGKVATNYIDQLYRELNAGATVDPRETPWKSLISKFKKSSVLLSASVWVQQFSSIGRAYAVIDPKYFTGTKVNSDTQMAVADEMKKYAPVAIIKEMGGFDTGTKGSAKSYIMAEQYGKGERFKGLLKDEQYRGDIMGYLPAKADEKTWCAIWEAVKRETKANHPKMDVKSEEFLKLAGERFSEVIEKTQVYDSVLARSANMRSKGNFMAMATAFMAEPTTTINLLEDAIRSGKAKNIARAFGSVAVSIVLNNALASIVYAMRDDDDDETFLEKYFQSFTSGMIDDINPMSYYPFLKDVWSLFQGYDVERSDMSVIADVRDAMKQVYKYLSEDTSEMDDKKLAEHNKNLWGAFMSLLDAGCSTFVVPFKNIRRDANGLINAWNTVSKDLSGERDNSWLSFWDKVGAAAKDTIPFLAWTKDAPKEDKLYEAIVSGDKAYIDRLKAGYVDKDGNFSQSKYDSAVVKALRENDPRIKAAAQANVNGNAGERNRIKNEIKAELGTDYANYIILAINAETSAIRNEGKPDKVAGQYEAYDFVEAVSAGNANTAKAVREDIISTYVANGKTQTEAEKAFVSDVKTGIEEAYSYGDISKDVAKDMLIDYADMDEEDAADKITIWDFLNANPNCDLSESKVLDYLEFAEPAHVSLEVYEQFVAETKDLADIKDKWGDVEVTKREQVLEVIDSLPLSWQQKDALYLAYGYAESKIWDVPW